MRIVIVGPCVPHPFGDTAAKWSFALIRELLARGHEVTAIAAGEEPDSRIREAESLLRQNDGRKLTFSARRIAVDRFTLRRKLRNFLQPCSEMLQDQSLVAELDRELSKGYDVLHLEQLWSGWLGLERPRSLLNIHHFEVIDWEETKFRNFKDNKLAWQVRRGTERIVRNSSNMRMFTGRLLDKAKTINPNARYWVIPFALDLSLYQVQPLAEEPLLGLIGSMHWLPSRSAGERLLTRIWPRVKQRVPNARLLVAGWNARKYLERYVPQGSLDIQLENNLTHPEEFFSRAAVMAYAPSRGSGMKIKVLESMAYGVPVVTTWEGVEGIDCTNGVECWVEETDDAIADRVALLLQNREARLLMRDAARALLERQYSPAPVVDKILQVYSEVAKCA